MPGPDAIAYFFLISDSNNIKFLTEIQLTNLNEFHIIFIIYSVNQTELLQHDIELSSNFGKLKLEI